MPTFEHSLEIDAPLTTTFEFMTDPDNWVRTNPSLTGVEVVSESKDGLVADATYTVLGTSVDGTLTLDVEEPNVHTVITFDSPGMNGVLTHRYVESAGGTTVVQSADYEFGDSLAERLLEPVAKRYNRRQFEQALRTSKELIEAEVAVEAKPER